MTFVEDDGTEVKVEAELGATLLEVAHENDIELEGDDGAGETKGNEALVSLSDDKGCCKLRMKGSHGSVSSATCGTSIPPPTTRCFAEMPKRAGSTLA